MPNERPWQDRALRRLRRNETIPGAILLAVLGRSTAPPRFGREAKINHQGIVLTSVVGQVGRLFLEAYSDLPQG